MTERKDGGPAFPGQALGTDGLPVDEACPGMSLRDYFAGQALLGLSSGVMSDKTMEDLANGVIGGRFFAQAAYQLADAMLTTRGDE